MKTPEAVIDVQGVSLFAGTTTILDQITLAVPEGAVVGLVGRNGAGKSTLLRCMVGLTLPTRGTASLLGCPAEHLSDPVRERLGYVAQSPDLFEWMEVMEHLQAIGQAYPRWSEERCLMLATQLDLPLGKRVRDLSAGDQQKMAVVLALAHDPDVLILDEPVSSLDPLTRREFMRSLFQDRGVVGASAAEPRQRTVVISSHLLSDLERVVTHVAFLRKGHLQVFEGWDTMLEHFRLLPSGVDAPSAALVTRNQKSGQAVVDTRVAPALAEAGTAMSLDELFVELNA